jgi:hypothetical protein
MGLILLLILIILIAGTLPQWSYARSWGYYPSGVLGLILILLVVLLVCQVFPFL